MGVFVWMCEDANEYIDADTFAYERLEAGIKVEGTRTTGITEFCTTASFDLKEILEVFVSPTNTNMKWPRGAQYSAVR